MLSISSISGVLCALFLLAGRWDFSRINGDESDFTMIMQPRLWLIVFLAAVVAVQLNHPRALPRLRLERSEKWLLLLFAYLIISLAWAPDAELTGVKALELMLEAAALALLALSLRLSNRDRLEFGFWSTLLVVGLVLACLSIAASATGRAVTPGGGPITFGRNMGFMGIAAWRLAERSSTRRQLLAGGVMALAVLLVVVSGSRGALLAYAVAICVLVLLARISLSRRVIAIVVIGFTTGGMMLFTNAGRNATEVFRNRIIETTLHKHHLAGREELWLLALDLIKEKPLWGWGVNGFRANSWHYPHNLFLEITTEGGVIGLGMLLLAILGWIHTSWRRRAHAYSGAIAAMVLALVSAQTSGDLYDSRCFFMLLLMATPALPSPTRNAHPRRQSSVAAWGRLNRLPAID